MTSANPPPHQKLRLETVTKPELLIDYLNKLNFDLFLLWKKLGGGGDPFMATGVEIDGLFQPDAREQVKSDVVTTSVDVDTAGDQIIVCLQPLTVSLNATPEDQELVKVHSRFNGRLVIDGNGNKIEDEPDAIIRRKTTTWNFLYLVEFDGWIII